MPVGVGHRSWHLRRSRAGGRRRPSTARHPQCAGFHGITMLCCWQPRTAHPRPTEVFRSDGRAQMPAGAGAAGPQEGTGLTPAPDVPRHQAAAARAPPRFGVRSWFLVSWYGVSARWLADGQPGRARVRCWDRSPRRAPRGLHGLRPLFPRSPGPRRFAQPAPQEWTAPSQWPGTARSSTSAGRSLTKIMSGIFPDGPAAVERRGRRTARPVRRC